MNTDVITFKIKKNHMLLVLGVVVAVSVLVGGFLVVRAAFIQPDFAPGDSDQDFAQNILGANNADNEFNSRDVAGNPDGSIIERLQGIQEDYVSNFYSSLTKPQLYQVYDDYNCTNNNEGGTAACTSGDPECVSEEGLWASSTDSDISAEYIVSGIVKKDERTGLYWSDAFDETLGGDGAEDDIENDFCVIDNSAAPCSGSCSGAGGASCSGDDINVCTCEQSDYSCYDADGGTGVNWSAMDFCLDLELDADGDDVDETDWRLPTQKELLQAYIDGAANNLPNPAYSYWSSTEHYNSTASAWRVNLSNADTYYNPKTLSGSYARCVRR